MTTNNDENLQLDHTSGAAIALIVLIVGTMIVVGPAEMGTAMINGWGWIVWIITNLWNGLLGFVPIF